MTSLATLTHVRAGENAYAFEFSGTRGLVSLASLGANWRAAYTCSCVLASVANGQQTNWYRIGCFLIEATTCVSARTEPVPV